MDAEKHQQWVDIYSKYVNLVRHTVSKYANAEWHSNAVLDELTQDAWLKVYSYWDRIGMKSESERRTAIYTAAKTVTLDYLKYKTRQKRKWPEGGIVGRVKRSTLDIDEQGEVYMILRNLERGFDEMLTNLQREILSLYYDEGMSALEIAEHIGKCKTTVYDNLEKAHKELQTEVGTDPRELFSSLRTTMFDGCVEYGRYSSLDWSDYTGDDILNEQEEFNEDDYWREEY